MVHKNTSEFIPEEAIVPLLALDPDFPDFPFLSGTGFFVHCPPSEQVFLVTAAHCICNNKQKYLQEVHCVRKFNGADVRINFSSILMGKTVGSEGFFADIAVLCLDSVESDLNDFLFKESLVLRHQEDVEYISRSVLNIRGNLRILGYPSTDKNIDYDLGVLTVRARGLWGKLEAYSTERELGSVSNINWKNGDLRGFSGSPVIELLKFSRSEDVAVVPIGVVITGNQNRFDFVSINVATNLILEFISGNYDRDLETTV